MINEIIPTTKEILFDNVIDLSIDFAEIAIDGILDNEIVKDIPMLGTIVKTGKIIFSVRDRALLKKTFMFAKGLNDGSLSEEKIKQYRQGLELDSKRMNKEIEYIILILEKYIDNRNALILSNFYKAYINKNIDWENFEIFSGMLYRMNLQDLEVLKYLREEKTTLKKFIACSRLHALGLITCTGMVMSSSNDGKQFYASINEIGEMFVDFGLANIPIEIRNEILTD